MNFGRKAVVAGMGLVGMMSCGVAGCSAPDVTERRASTASHLDGAQAVFEITEGTGVNVLDGQIVICADQAPDAAAMAADVSQNLGRYDDGSTTGVPLVVHGDAGDRLFVVNPPQSSGRLAPDVCHAGETTWAMDIHRSPDDVFGDVRQIAALVLSDAFGYDKGKLSCEAGGTIDAPFHVDFDGPWGLQNDQFTLPSVRLGFSGEVEPSGELHCGLQTKIPLPPNLSLGGAAEAFASAGITVTATLPGAVDVSVSSSEGAKFQFPPAPTVSVTFGIKIKLFKMFEFKVDAALTPHDLQCSSEGNVTLTLSGGAAFAPEVENVHLSKSWGASVSRDFELSYPAFVCPAESGGDAPAPADSHADPTCEGGGISSDLAFCGRSPGTESTLYQCVNDQWQPLQDCANGCQQIGNGQDQCQ